MKQFITFFELKSSLRVSLLRFLCLLIFSIGGISNLSASQIIQPNDTLYACHGGITYFKLDYTDPDPNLVVSYFMYGWLISPNNWNLNTIRDITNPPWFIVDLESFQVIPSGIYPVTLSISTDGNDSNGNSYTATSNINLVLVIYDNNLNTIVTNPTCGQANGSIDLTIGGAGSMPPFTYSWNNGQTSQDISNLAGGTYTVTVIDLLICHMHHTDILPGVVNGLTTNTPTVCTGGSAQITVINPTINTTYTWQESTNGGNNWTDILGYINTDSLHYTTDNLIGSQSYRLISNGPCGIDTSSVLNINVVADPVLTVSANHNNYCVGTYSNLYLSANFTGGVPNSYTYQWQKYTGNAWVSSNSYIGTLLDTTKYRLLVSTTGNGCTISGTDSIEVFVKPKPVVYITATNTAIICPGGTATLTSTGANSYSWSPATGLNTTIDSTVIASPSSNITYTVTGIGLNGCTDTAQKAITYTTNPSVLITDNGPDHCDGTSYILTVNPNSYIGYTNPTFQWKKNGLPIPNATNANYTSSSLMNNDVIVCEVTTNQNCNPIITSDTINIQYLQANALYVPTIKINQPNIQCFTGYFNLTTSYTFAGDNPSFQWKKNGINIGVNSPNLTNAYGYPGDVVTCEMTSDLACALNIPISSQAVHLGDNDYFVQSSSNVKEACLGDLITCNIAMGYCENCGCYYFEGNEYDEFGNATPFGQGISGTPSAIVKAGSFIASQVGYQGLGIDVSLEPCLFGAGNCGFAFLAGSVGSYIFPDNFTPNINITMDTIQTNCNGGIFLFSATPHGGGNPSYQWKINGIDAPGGNYQQFASASLHSGDIVTCDLTSSLHCAMTPTVTSNAITVSIPNQAGLTSTNPTICTSGASTLSLVSGGGTSAYTWQQSTNGGSSWYSVSGTNTTTTNTIATLTATRLFRVIYTSTCGIDTTPVFTLTVVPDPTVTLTASNNNFCAGTSTTNLTATLNGGVGTGIYQWQQYIGSVWTNIAGATNATYTSPIISANTNYKVISSQTGLGCVTLGPNTINIILKPLPNVYTLPASATILNGNSVTLQAYNGTSYSWSPATGLNTTTGSTVIANPNTTTIYSVTGIGTNGCSKTVNLPVTVNYSTAVEEEHIQSMELYPNPANTKLGILLNTSSEQIFSFTIYDLLSKTLTQWQGKAEKGLYQQEISIENLSQGIYFLSVKIGENIMTQKFIKE